MMCIWQAPTDFVAQGMMKTEAGRRIAESRHAFMEAFLEEFMLEWDAQA